MKQYDANLDANKIEMRRQLVISGAQADESTGLLTQAEAATIVEKANAAMTLKEIEAVSTEYSVMVIPRRTL